MADANLASLLRWLDDSPTPFHVVRTAVSTLASHEFKEQESFSAPLHDRGYSILDGSIVAWRLGTSEGAFRVIGAHTDSPNLRVQPSPDMRTAGWAQLGVEIYGGVLLNSWLDRDLGLAGRVVDLHGDVRLFNHEAPIARLPQLAIHLDREIGDRGLVLDRHQHTSPVWGLDAPSFQEWLSSITGVTDIMAFDAHLYDVTRAALLGVDQSLLASARLDNQVSCWAAINALCDAEASEHTTVVILNDHEEVGSESTTGAAGPLLENLVGSISRQHHLDAGRHTDRLRRSWCLSADNAHAIHPNYQERHDPRHAPRPNAGPALKLNGNQRYATSAVGAAHIRGVAEAAGVPLQTFVSRNNMPCGSTIGPITSTRLGISAIDIGVPQLSMHSARELCGAEDPLHLLRLATKFLSV